ncbi:SPFH domain-containing protein [Streptomyces sp. NPDC055254]
MPAHPLVGGEGGDLVGAAIPHPQDEAGHADTAALRLSTAAAPNSGVPGPGMAEIVARAVSRGMEHREDPDQQGRGQQPWNEPPLREPRVEREEEDTQDIPRVLPHHLAEDRPYRDEPSLRQHLPQSREHNLPHGPAPSHPQDRPQGPAQGFAPSHPQDPTQGRPQGQAPSHPQDRPPGHAPSPAQDSVQDPAQGHVPSHPQDSAPGHVPSPAQAQDSVQDSAPGHVPSPAQGHVPSPAQGPAPSHPPSPAQGPAPSHPQGPAQGQPYRTGAGSPEGGGAADVPVHLPFRAAAARAVHPGPAPAKAPAPAPAVRRAPGRRVPRGDDRLREHRGPVLPGWVGVGIGGLAIAGCAAVLWRAGVVPATLVAAFGATPRAYAGLRATHWPPLAFLGVVALLALGGLGRSRTGHAWVLTLFGRYRGTVRRTGLTWISPLLLRRRVDVRLRHWRSDPMPAVDSDGLALQVVVQVVWQVKDTARATLAVEDHTEYLAEQVESAMARVLSQLPADAFHEDAPTLRDAEAVGDALTQMLAAETEAVGIEVFSAQPIRIEYAAEVAEAMRRRRVAAIDAKHRDTVLSSVVDAVDDTVHRLTSRGLVELDDYERKALVKDLTVAFYTGRSE